LDRRKCSIFPGLSGGGGRHPGGDGEQAAGRRSSGAAARRPTVALNRLPDVTSLWPEDGNSDNSVVMPGGRSTGDRQDAAR